MPFLRPAPCALRQPPPIFLRQPPAASRQPPPIFLRQPPAASRQSVRFATVLVVAAGWALLQPTLRAQDAAAPPALTALLVHSAEERRGDYDALAARWLEALPSAGSDFRSELLVRRLGRIESSLRDPAALLPLIEKALEAEALRADTRHELRELLAVAYGRAGRFEDARRVLETCGFLETFVAAGPFGKGEHGVLERSYAPEVSIDLAAKYLDGWQEIAWRKVDLGALEVSRAHVEPFAHAFPRAGVVYFLAQLRSREDREAVVRIESSGRLRLWLNGTLVHDDAGGRELLAHDRRAGVKLRSGWNRLLVKSNRAFRLRLTGAEGEPLAGHAVEQEDALELHAVDTDPNACWENGARGGALAEWQAWLSKPPPGTDDFDLAAERMGLALLHAALGRDDLAVQAAQKALDSSPQDRYLFYHAGVVFRGAEYLPPTLRKNRAREAWEKAVQADGGFAPAVEALAALLQEDSKFKEAAERVRGFLEKEPSFFGGHLRLRRIYAQAGWEAEEIEVLHRIQVLSPARASAQLHEAERAIERGNLPRGIELYRRAHELDRSQDSLLASLARLELGRGNVAQAESDLRAYLHRRPGDLGALSTLCSLLHDRGEATSAVDAARAAAERESWNPQAVRLLALVLDRAGREEESRIAYRRLLALDSDTRGIERTLARAEGASEAFWKPYDERLEDWLPRVPAEGPLVERSGAVSILDLSVVKVRPDGSSRQYTHQAFQLLTEEAKETLARVQVPGEVHVLRTVLPGGESLEPVDATGKNEFVMPGLIPGAVTEMAYLSEDPSRSGAGFQFDGFFFQDPRFQQAFLLSRLVLILPAGFDGTVLETQLRAAEGDSGLAKLEKTEQRLEDGGRIVVYEARNAPRLERENGMPSTQEYLPRIEVEPRQDWDDIAHTLAARVRDADFLTPELRAAAAEATDGLDDPHKRALALHRYVNGLVTADQGPGNAVGVLLEKSGSRTTLFKALLDACGVPASWAFLRMHEDLYFRPHWEAPSAEFFPWRFVLVEPKAGERHWVSLESRHAPYGQLPEYLSGGKAFVLGGGAGRLETLPSLAPEDYAAETTVDIALSAEGTAEVAFTVLSRSVQSYAQKERLRSLNGFQRNLAANTIASRMFPGAKVSRAEFPGLEEAGQPFALSFSLTTTSLLKQSGEDRTLALTQQPSSMVRIFGGPQERKHPYHLRQFRAQRDVTTIRTGGHWTAAKVPPPVNLAHKLGVYTLSVRAAGEELVISRTLSLVPGALDPAEYPAFLAFSKEIDSAEGESISLRPSLRPSGR